ncbi:hypothetical protein DERP_009430 [Dermatophagoides pteronyssinus]|uniref:Uncharacterized protein n=1 Tax=Dermatophagoides pteronyssinus TaxID=6956 RepID=A0ABQ8IUF3_DERPT|nr:hypothetical protein DERP_009430 [Dermatophagoides pteronyssinus]
MEFRKQKIPKFNNNNSNNGKINLTRRQKQQQQQQQKRNNDNNRNKNDFTLQSILQASGMNPLTTLFENLFIPAFDNHTTAAVDSLEFVPMINNDLKTPREKDEQQMNEIIELIEKSETIITDKIEQQIKDESNDNDNHLNEIEKIMEKIQKQIIDDDEK